MRVNVPACTKPGPEFGKFFSMFLKLGERIDAMSASGAMTSALFAAARSPTRSFPCCDNSLGPRHPGGSG
jgi:hypothetical protein